MTSDKWKLLYNGLIFNENILRKHTFILIFRFYKLVITHQTWYSQGYHANIASYTIDLSHMLVKKQFSRANLDFMNIWTHQNIPDAVSKALTESAALVCDKLINPKREVENVTQLRKQDKCWRSIHVLSTVNLIILGYTL